MQKNFMDRRSRFVRRDFLAAGMLAALAASVPTGAAWAANPERGFVVDPRAAPAETATTAAVVSEVPFNPFVNLKCDASICTGQLPIVRATERVVLQFISCTVDATTDTVFRQFYLQVTDARVTRIRGYLLLPATYESARLTQTMIFGVGQPITLVVQPGSMVHVGANAIGQLGNARCTLSGVKQTLG